MSPTRDTLRVATLNVAHGRRQSFHQSLLGSRQVRRNLQAISDVFRREQPHIVALQEADGPCNWSGFFDHVEYLCERVGFAHHCRGTHTRLRRGFLDLDYGTALIGEVPLDEVMSFAFDSSWRDTKGFVTATARIPQWNDLEVDVVSVHLDFLRNEGRARQTVMLVEELATRNRPMILLGDLNTTGGRRDKTISLLQEGLGLRAHPDSHEQPTFPARKPYKRIDWILVSDVFEFDDYRTLDDQVSDHLGVVADLGLR